MSTEKQKAFLLNVLFVITILGLFYICIKYLLPLLMPFVIGIIISMVFRRLIDLIQKKFHIKRYIVSILILIVFYGILVLLLSLIGVRIFTFVQDLFSKLPSLYENTIEPAFIKAANNLMLEYPSIEPYVEDFLANTNNSIQAFVINASTTVISTITALAGQIPSLLIKLIFTIVASFFFTIDYYRITDFIIRQFKGERKEMILRLKDNGIGTLAKFIRAYLAIISITFIELTLGFWILGIPNAPLFGALIAIIDILPILGTGAVLLPWSIIAFVIGNSKIGLGILILYIVITVVRQAVEPKIVGQQIGLHPLLTLILMYVGVQLMGVLGLLLLPVIATIIKKLNDEGTIHLFQ